MTNTPGQDDVPATDRAIMRGAERILKLYRISPGCIPPDLVQGAV
jgi:hypothetical protein